MNARQYRRPPPPPPPPPPREPPPPPWNHPCPASHPPLPPPRPGAILGTVRTLRVFLLAALAVAPLSAADAARIALQGTWNIQLDPAGAGHSERWFERRFQGDTMFLPGSTDQAGYGAKTVTPDKGWLTRPYKYAGAAWYQKDVTVPESWRGRRITLFLERPHWQTELWVDGRPLGMRNSLSTPHEYDLSALLG